MKKIEKEAKEQNNADHNSEKKQKRKRTRNIIYYNPPYNQLVQTNLGYEVRKIIKKCFPKENKISKILNKNTIKVSYSTTANLEAKIKKHNSQINRKAEKENSNSVKK